MEYEAGILFWGCGLDLYTEYLISNDTNRQKNMKEGLYLEGNRSAVGVPNLECLRHLCCKWPYMPVRYFLRTMAELPTVETQLHRIDFDRHLCGS
jgi:hypothetical protein